MNGSHLQLRKPRPGRGQFTRKKMGELSPLPVCPSAGVRHAVLPSLQKPPCVLTWHRRGLRITPGPHWSSHKRPPLAGGAMQGWGRIQIQAARGCRELRDGRGWSCCHIEGAKKCLEHLPGHADSTPLFFLLFWPPSVAGSRHALRTPRSPEGYSKCSE